MRRGWSGLPSSSLPLGCSSPRCSAGGRNHNLIHVVAGYRAPARVSRSTEMPPSRPHCGPSRSVVHISQLRRGGMPYRSQYGTASTVPRASIWRAVGWVTIIIAAGRGGEVLAWLSLGNWAITPHSPSRGLERRRCLGGGCFCPGKYIIFGASYLVVDGTSSQRLSWIEGRRIVLFHGMARRLRSARYICFVFWMDGSVLLLLRADAKCRWFGSTGSTYVTSA